MTVNITSPTHSVCGFLNKYFNSWISFPSCIQNRCTNFNIFRKLIVCIRFFYNIDPRENKLAENLLPSFYVLLQ